MAKGAALSTEVAPDYVALHPGQNGAYPAFVAWMIRSAIRAPSFVIRSPDAAERNPGSYFRKFHGNLALGLPGLRFTPSGLRCGCHDEASYLKNVPVARVRVHDQCS